MRNELEYNLFVKQPCDAVMEQVEQDAHAWGITSEELNRAVLNWVMGRIKQGEVPDWFLKDLETE